MSSALQRPAFFGLAVGSLAVVAGCQAGDVAGTVGGDNAVDPAVTEPAEMTQTPDDVATAIGPLADGTYTAVGNYQSPNGQETVLVTISISDGVVTAADVDPQATNSTSSRYQGQFAGGIADEVVGKPVAELDVTRIAGSSLTGRGFNEALEEIRSEAAANAAASSDSTS